MSGTAPGGAPFRVAVVTVSDRCARGEAEDGSGPAVEAAVTRGLPDAGVVRRALLPDEPDRIAELLREWADGDSPPDLVLTTGGTGLGPRDRTPEATLSVIDRRHPGLMEKVRSEGAVRTPMAWLSRGEAGVRGRTLIVNLPGSPRGAVESIEALLDVLPHALRVLRGPGGEIDHPPPPGESGA